MPVQLPYRVRNLKLDLRSMELSLDRRPGRFTIQQKHDVSQVFGGHLGFACFVVIRPLERPEVKRTNGIQECGLLEAPGDICRHHPRASAPQHPGRVFFLSRASDFSWKIRR
jgi:hypothetical protein